MIVTCVHHVINKPIAISGKLGRGGSQSRERRSNHPFEINNLSLGKTEGPFICGGGTAHACMLRHCGCLGRLAGGRVAGYEVAVLRQVRAQQAGQPLAGVGAQPPVLLQLARDSKPVDEHGAGGGRARQRGVADGRREGAGGVSDNIDIVALWVCFVGGCMCVVCVYMFVCRGRQEGVGR